MTLDIQGLSVGDAPELTRVLLAAFVEGEPPEAAREELQRYLWNSGSFGLAIPLSSALPVLRTGQAGNFIYHQKPQLLFTGVSHANHQLLMAYLAALNKTDFKSPMDDWGPDCIYQWNANAKLADEFIESGFGLYRSSQHAPNTIRVSPEFAWTAQEKRVFAGFQRMKL